MTTLGLPHFFEDTTGTVSGPTDFLDIYDRPPFLRLDRTRSQHSSRSRTEPGKTLAIFELGAPSFVRSCGRHGVPPSAVLAFHDGMAGTVKFESGMAVAMEKWLKKSNTFGSTLTRQFKGSDGMYYRWSHRGAHDHEWTCVQLGTNYLVAHYDLRSVWEPRYTTSGNVLTVYESWIHLAVELFASFVIMRHIHAATDPVLP